MFLESAGASTAVHVPDPSDAPGMPGEFYRDLVLSMRNGVLAIRRDSTVAVFNEVAYQLLGITPEFDHIGRHYRDILGLDHEFSAVLGSAYELSHLPNREEVRLGGSGRVLGYTLSRIHDGADDVIGAVLFFKDLTRVEQLEERERLRERLAAIGEMAAAIAHEVKNPLAGIQVMAGLLKRQHPNSTDNQAVLNDIINEAQVANKIVVDLLEFVRPIRLQIERASISDLLRDAIKKCGNHGARAGILLETSLQPDLPQVPGDSTQLRQVFTNLLVNALEAMNGRGQLRMRASFVAGEDAQPAPPDAGGSVVVDVHDNGPGIPSDVAEKIFSPFFTTKPRGSGLGLAIVRKIVDAHDGRIDVSAGPDGGTRFRVTLPVARNIDEKGPEAGRGQQGESWQTRES